MTDPKPVEGQVPDPPPRKKLLAITLGGFVAAALIAVLFVLPAESGLDLTGFGKATGLTRLARPKAAKVTAAPAAPAGAPARAAAPTRDYPAPYRSDVVDIRLDTADKAPENSELEYKVRMKAGDSLVYSWTVSGLTNPEEFYSDFHGETPAQGSTAATVVEYRQATGLTSNGMLVAPIPGVHGWYLQNQSAVPVVVHLKMSGFYELVPPGDYGNTAGVKARAAKD